MSNTENTTFVIELIAQRFAPFAAVGGPLFAGKLTIRERPATVYLTQAQVWLYLTTAHQDAGQLSHADLSTMLPPATVVRSLLHSMSATAHDFESYLDHLERTADDLTTTLGFYLADSTAAVVDAIALRHFHGLSLMRIEHLHGKARRNIASL